ncbi:ATP-dependent RNA helicase DHX30-like [Oppia nitens]|uniref:ATP-dependent RNA helicase DHX30-like n=1 Tax=Oppia nitens TaxID=1686743 RepID=UPI0023D98A04|nr:ATP-dependent RNA helicase DHX30-like [Oppia nitens]
MTNRLNVLINISINRLNTSFKVINRQSLRYLSQTMNNDIYNEEYWPPILRQKGQTLTRFKRFFYESDYQRKPQIESKSVNDLWLTKCHIIEPKEVVFTAKAKRKKESETIVMGKALMWLRDNEFVDNNFNAIQLNTQQIREWFDIINGPIHVKPIDEQLSNDMINFCDDFDDKLKDKLNEMIDKNSEKMLINCTEEGFAEEDKPNVIRNVFSNVIHNEPTDRTVKVRNNLLLKFLNERHKRQETDDSFRSLRQQIEELPINKYREQILKEINENRVIVISGDTGCGKTTQIPQMIFENEIKGGRGAFANIVVTQPRRLSAISISERVALEFGEEVIGKSIGYNVRFDKSVPMYSNGVILFCSAGILLRKIGYNPSLLGVSYIIVDEVHERDVITDFLLVLLKRALDLNENLKLIFMSASMNTNLLVNYFNCPLIEVPGRCFQVNNYYLNEFIENTGNHSFSIRNPKVDINLVTQLIVDIHRKKPDGAILCFLPGWAEIQAVDNQLNMLNIDSNLKVFAVHSRLSHSIQKQIFTRMPIGVRKVVLATNIAETSLTIDDVVYVIDTGLAKVMKYNSQFNVSNFGTNWISKANAKQRSGRAGRVTEGECYRLYTKELENSLMDEYMTPEMLRIPLENVVMSAKFHVPNESIHDFLSLVPQPPSNESIRRAVNILKDLNILDTKENLTILGKRVISFTSHPRLSVAMIYSVFFSCLKSMLPLVSHLSANREPFQVMPNAKSVIRSVKDNFSFDFISDHISMAALILEYQECIGDYPVYSEKIKNFIDDNHLHRYSMDFILDTIKLYASHLEESNFISRNEWISNKSHINSNFYRKSLITTALVPAFVSNYVRLIKGEIRNQKLKLDSIYPINAITGYKVKFVGESVFQKNLNAHQNVDQLTNSILIYFKSFFSEEAKMLTICDASQVSPIAIILFSMDRLTINKNYSKDECLVELNDNKHMKFKLRKVDMKLLIRLTQVLNIFFNWFITCKDINQLLSQDNQQYQKILDFHRDLIDLISDLVSTKS